ncbi:MAG: hypothetical protein M1813_005545 [Trichoglossum hirsutum]|nr:MAG: hypothetical protein M1813_005545 [Trichoglossum hirsutum]
MITTASNPMNGRNTSEEDYDDENVELEEMEEDKEDDTAEDRARDQEGDANMVDDEALSDDQDIGLHMDIDASNIQPPSEDTYGPTLGESRLETQSKVTRSVTNLKGMTHSLSGGSGGSGGQANQKATSLKAAQRKSRPGYCSCSIGVRKLVSSFAVSPEAAHQGAALASLREIAPFESVCRNHLRLFAGNALDMVTNITTTALLERLEWIYPRKRQMLDMRRVRPSWFRGQSGDVWRETLPALVKGIKGERDDFNFDAAQVFNRFAGEDS